jgi:hypothetical protein
MTISVYTGIQDDPSFKLTIHSTFGLHLPGKMSIK